MLDRYYTFEMSMSERFSNEIKSKQLNYNYFCCQTMFRASAPCYAKNFVSKDRRDCVIKTRLSGPNRSHKKDIDVWKLCFPIKKILQWLIILQLRSQGVSALKQVCLSSNVKLSLSQCKILHNFVIYLSEFHTNISYTALQVITNCIVYTTHAYTLKVIKQF